MILRYLKAAWTLLLSLGGFLLGILLMQSRTNRREKKELGARVEHAKKVMTQDEEIQREHDVRTEELAREVESKGTSSELSDPNRW